MSQRDSFLANVRRAAEQGRMFRVRTRATPERVGYVGAFGDLVERLALEVNAVGGQAYVVADLEAAAEQLHVLLAEAGGGEHAVDAAVDARGRSGACLRCSPPHDVASIELDDHVRRQRLRLRDAVGERDLA